jgi:acetyl esterase/lipase
VISSVSAPHVQSYENLLGKNPAPELFDMFSLEKHVHDKVPPTFIWHTSEDDAVPAENSLRYALSLAEKKVPYELHLYEKGFHGLGLGTIANRKFFHVRSWPSLMEVWLRTHHWL